MHPLNRGKRYPLTVGELLRSDLTRLRGAFVAVALVKFNPPLGVIAHTFAIVGIGLELLVTGWGC